MTRRKSRVTRLKLISELDRLHVVVYHHHVRVQHCRGRTNLELASEIGRLRRKGRGLGLIS